VSGREFHIIILTVIHAKTCVCVVRADGVVMGGVVETRHNSLRLIHSQVYYQAEILLQSFLADRTLVKVELLARVVVRRPSVCLSVCHGCIVAKR